LHNSQLTVIVFSKKKEFQGGNISIVQDIWHLFSKLLYVYPEIP